VPLIVVAPGTKQPGMATHHPVELLDVYPTLVELAGLPGVDGIDGTSLVPLLEDPTRRLKPAAYSFRRATPPRLGWSVRTDRYRYTEWPDGSRELYDHDSDPGEYRNLAEAAEHAERVESLRQLLESGDRHAVAGDGQR